MQKLATPHPAESLKKEYSGGEMKNNSAQRDIVGEQTDYAINSQKQPLSTRHRRIKKRNKNFTIFFSLFLIRKWVKIVFYKRNGPNASYVIYIKNKQI